MTKKGPARPLPTRFAGPMTSPGFLLWRISNAWQRRQRAALQPLGLTHSQFVLLATATWFGATEVLTQARLSELSGVDAMTTSQILRALEAAKLVQRRAHPDDPRARAVHVTANGREKVGKAIVLVERVDAAFFMPVASSARRMVALFRALVDASAD